MIQSNEKLADLRERYECLELMEFCLLRGLVVEAKEFGELSQWYSERIKRNNYVALDAKWALYHKVRGTL